jgi:DOPA 4,5-dioxygenase
MFEVNLFTPAQFGAFVPWLAIWRGPLSVLVHPNTTEPGVSEAERDLRNHTQRAIWMGERIPLDVGRFVRGLPGVGGSQAVGSGGKMSS